MRFPKDINSRSQKLNWIARKSGYSSWNHFKKLVPDKNTCLNDLVEREDIFITIGKKRSEIINSYIETYKVLYGDLAFFFRFEKYPVAYEYNINFLEELFTEEEIVLEKRNFFHINRNFFI